LADIRRQVEAAHFPRGTHEEMVEKVDEAQDILSDVSFKLNILKLL
jgi:hypothetical protein